MAPKKRDPKNSDLTGTNIKVSVKGGKEYFYYIMPDGSHEPLLHGDKRGSIEAAIALNQALRPSGCVVDRIIARPPAPTSKNPLLVEVLQQFENEWLPKQGYSPKVIGLRKQKLALYARTWPHELIGDIGTFEVAQFLRNYSAEAARQHRNVLDPLFRFAASEGYQTQRPMQDIERRKVEKRKRARHTWEGHLAIYNAAEPWLQRAILIALYSLQRRGDLVVINIKEQINFQERTIQIFQQKSRNYDKPVFIDITMGDELYAAVMSAVKSDIPCPYLIHHRPKTIRRNIIDPKPHPFAVTADHLTKSYSAVRDAIGVYDDLPVIQRPGFHSLRALGIWMYGKAGYPDEYIMALAGHASEKMKAHYIDGHEKQKPVKVSAGLSLKGMDFSGVNWETDLSAALRKLSDSD